MARRPAAPMKMISLTAGFTTLSAGLLLVFSSFLLQAYGGASSSEEESYVPLPIVLYRFISPAVAPYEPFEVCKTGCRCCTSPSNASTCVDMSCCYAINCNLPGKPFGTCAFTPKTCGCGADNNCNQPAS